MKFNSKDVAFQRFEVRFRGFDREQVREFLTVIAAHLGDYQVENQRLMAENDELRQEVTQARRRVRELEQELDDANATATERRARAEREAEVIIAEAELAAERKLVAAERAVGAARDALTALKDQRRRVISEMRGTLEMHLHLIDSQKEPAYFSELEGEEESDEQRRSDTLPGLF